MTLELDAPAAQPPGPLAPLTDFPSLEAQHFHLPAEEQVHGLSKRGRQVALSDDIELHFKTTEDAGACDLAVSGDRLRIDASRCKREVRLLYRLSRMSGALRGAPANAVCTLGVQLELGGSDQGAGIQWIALLSEQPGGGLQIWQSVAKRVRFNDDAVARRSWAVDTESRPGEDEELFLTLQLVAGASPVEVGKVRVGLERIVFSGGLEIRGGRVTGAWGSGPASDVVLWLLGEDGPAANAALDQIAEAEVSLAEDGFRFSIPLPALLAAWGRVAPRLLQDGALALAVSGALAAQVKVRAEWKPGPDAGRDQSTPVLQSVRRGEPSGPLGLAGSDPDVIARELLIAGPDLVRGTLRHLFEQRDYGRLRRLHEALGERTGKRELDAYLAFYFARAAMQLNLHSTGLQTLDRLLRSPSLMEVLPPAERDEAKRFLVHATVRAGARERAVHELSRLAREQPYDWRPRFDLGLLSMTTAPGERRLQFRVAAALADDIPFAEAAVMLEAMIDDDRAEDALIEGLRRGGRFGSEPQIHLTLANIHLALGRPHDWAAHLNAFFEAYDLGGGVFDGETGPGDVLQALSFAAPAGPDDRSGPLVTVVMAAFNARATIEHSIRSVLRQSHANLKLIVVDDASSDGTPDVVAALRDADPRVSMVTGETNVGPYAAKNRALAEIEAGFVTFHDADDWMHPLRLARHVARMEGGNLVCSTSSWFRMTPEGRAVVRLMPGRHGYLTENPTSPFLRREVFDEIGFFDDVRAAADSEFLYRLRRRFGPAACAQVPEPLAIGLRRAGSITASGSTALDEYGFSAPRNAYWEAWMNWHYAAREAAELHVPFPHEPRKFAAPPELTAMRCKGQ